MPRGPLGILVVTDRSVTQANGIVDTLTIGGAFTAGDRGVVLAALKCNTAGTEFSYASATQGWVYLGEKVRRTATRTSATDVDFVVTQGTHIPNGVRELLVSFQLPTTGGGGAFANCTTSIKPAAGSALALVDSRTVFDPGSSQGIVSFTARIPLLAATTPGGTGFGDTTIHCVVSGSGSAWTATTNGLVMDILGWRLI